MNWGSGQQLVISEFDMGGGGESRLFDDADMSFAFDERRTDKKLFLFVDVEDKPKEVLSNSIVTKAAMRNMGYDSVVDFQQ